jgi:HEAT repeat protein
VTIWSSTYVLALGAFFLLWAGVSAYVLTTRALYDFRHLAFHGTRRVVRHWLANAKTPDERDAVLRRLPRRTLSGVASDAHVEREVAAAAARILLERRWPRLLARASRHRNEAEKWARIAALRVFSLADWHIAWPLLREALRDEDPDVVAGAVALLGERDEDDARVLLTEALVENRLQRSRIAMHLDTHAAARHLLPLVDHRDEEVRYWAATILRPAADAPEVELALAGLAGDPSPTVRAAVAKSFAAVGGEAAAAIGETLLTDPVWFVRAQAARALAAAGRPDLSFALVALLRDEQWWVRTAAKEALTTLGSQAVPAVVTMLRDEDGFARNGAAEVLFETGTVARWLEKAAHEPDDTTLSRLLTDTLVAGGEPLRTAAVARAHGPGRHKLERLLERIPESQTA